MKYYNIYRALVLCLGILNIQAEQSPTAACAEYAAMKVGEAGKDLSAGTLFLLGEIAEKGINIRKFHFSGSLDGLETGTLPQVEIEGIVFGKPFHITLNIADEDLEIPTKLVAKIAEKIEENEKIPENQLVPATSKIKE